MTPADVTRVEVYSLDGDETLPAADVLQRGKLVGAVPVNPPADPDAAPDAPKPSVPGGFDQGASASISDDMATVDTAQVRSYVAVGINRRGRRGAPSPVVGVPAAASPLPPAAPAVTYDQDAVTLSWPKAEDDADAEEARRFHVYETTSSGEARLTSTPVSESSYQDVRMTWGAERCYAVRSVVTVAEVPIEGAASMPACVTLTDTFPPATPSGLQTVPEAGGVSLIWNPVDDADLAGYVILRAIAPATELSSITPEPIQETTFRDTVPSGARATYAVQAVDRAGNVSPMSDRREESAR